jgi:5-methylcytosine-specific restriction enzyme subunit McrC
MLAYCTALSLPRGQLIYARGDGEPARHTVRESDVELLDHALDLNADPEALFSQIRDLASLLADHAIDR